MLNAWNRKKNMKTKKKHLNYPLYIYVGFPRISFIIIVASVLCVCKHSSDISSCFYLCFFCVCHFYALTNEEWRRKRTFTLVVVDVLSNFSTFQFHHRSHECHSVFIFLFFILSIFFFIPFLFSSIRLLGVMKNFSMTLKLKTSVSELKFKKCDKNARQKEDW